MSIEVRVPALGESILDATLATWLKHEGDPVSQGEPLVELETDKVNVEVSAEQDGILQKRVKQVGDVVAIGEVLGILSTGSASVPTKSVAMAERVASTEAGSPSSLEAHRAPSPLARRIAADHNVDISQVIGTSPHGRVTKDDVINYLEQNTPMPNSQPRDITASLPAVLKLVKEPTGREERIQMSRRRQTIARRLVEAQQTAAMLTTFNEIDMTAIMEVRSRRKDSFKERYHVSLGFMSFFTKAVVGSLKTFPRLNAEIQENELVLKRYYDIGIAVGAEEGLVVPVLREADRKSFAEIEREIADLAARARENTLALSDLQGGTFTITNGGVFGSLLSTPILNMPQVGILGMHKIEQRPIALNGQVVIRPMMYVALSYDHRIVDGREAVQFLVKIKELLEDPETLLLEG